MRDVQKYLPVFYSICISLDVVKYSPITQTTKVSEWTAKLTCIIKLVTFKVVNHDTNTSRNRKSFKYVYKKHYSV